MSNESKSTRMLSLPLWRIVIQVVGIVLFYVVFTWAMLHDSILA